MSPVAAFRRYLQEALCADRIRPCCTGISYMKHYVQIASVCAALVSVTGRIMCRSHPSVLQWYHRLNRPYDFHEVRCTNSLKTKEVEQALVPENRLKSQPILLCPTVAPEGQDLIIIIIIEASRSHSDTPQSVEILWTGDQPYAETST